MSARIALPVLLLATTLCGALAREAAAGAWALAPGEFYSELRAGWFSSDIRLDHNGDKRYLRGGGLWEERSLLSYTELGWKPRLSFILGLPAKSVTRRFGAAAEERVLPTNSGLGDALVGFRYRLASGSSALALELDWKAPLGYERRPTLTAQDARVGGDLSGDGDSLSVTASRELGSPLLGDGQQDVSLALHLGTRVPRGFAQGSVGYQYRFESPADQVVMGADLGFWLGRSLLLGGRYDGTFSLGKNEEEDLASEVSRHRVGPVLLYRVDDHLDLFAATLHTAVGKNVFHTDEVFVGVAFKQTKLNRYQGFLGNAASP